METTLKQINPENPLTPEAREQIVALAHRQRKANGVLMKAITFVGNQVEDGMKILPKGFRDQVEGAAKSALRHSYDLAHTSRKGGLGKAIAGERMHKLIAVMSGALGGIGGVPTALAELPVATTVIFRAVQGVAETYGEDPEAEETRIECLRVFGAGGPGTDDDGIDTTFIGARLSISGPAINGLISKIAPRFATVLSQKLASQSVPVLGAAAGAGTNFAFVNYYTEMAHVHFGLRQLSRYYDESEVLEAFHTAVHTREIPVKRG